MHSLPLLLILAAADLHGALQALHNFKRRDMLALHAASCVVCPAFASGIMSSTSIHVAASWSATDGFSDASFISFDEGAYAAMRDDARRTPLFAEAIQKRLAGQPGELTVLDIGTGPFALLALIAARAGAKKVYAIEASKEAAKRARKTIAAAKDVPPGTITVIEGFSTQIALDEKVDLVLAEIVGSVASEEGLYATISDAQRRLVKKPYDPSSYIPQRCQTLAAPASFALHYSLGPPQFDWTRLKEPVRLNCRDETAQLLADPELVEDIAFYSPDLPTPGRLASSARLSFSVSAERLRANEALYRAELLREGASAEEASSLSAAVAQSFSGLALWPRLVLDDDIVVESRGPRGEAQQSHWQTVLPLTSARPVAVAAGDEIGLAYAVDIGQRVAAPAKYTISGQVTSRNLAAK